ncbi:SIS domain-containing protein [bacterium]|nr:SIS domain-containing protein [bacterium]
MFNFKSILDSHTQAATSLLNHENNILEVCDLIARRLSSGSKLLLFGNGGSAADCQHIAAEIVGRFKYERIGYPAIALTTDTSILTSISNDYDFSTIFSRQVSSLAASGDVVIALSTSGNSQNVFNGLIAANKIGCHTIALTGADGGRVAEISNFLLPVNSLDTARIQEIHILIGHIICDYFDSFLSGE